MLKVCNTDTEQIARNVSISNEKESNRFKRNWSQLNMKYYPCMYLEYEKRRMTCKRSSGLCVSLANRTSGRAADVC